MRNDIKLSAKIVHNLDNRSGLWAEDKKDSEKKEEETKKEQTKNEIEQAVSNLKKMVKLLKFVEKKFFLFILQFVIGFWIIFEESNFEKYN